jgi:integrase
MPRPKPEVPWLHIRGGVYYVYWHDAAEQRTKRLSLRTRDPREARNLFTAFLSNGTLAQPRGTAELTVRQALIDYLEEHVEPKVVDKRRQRDIAEHLIAFFGDTPLAAVNIPMSRRYAKTRREGLIGGGAHAPDPRGSDGTICRELGVLQAAARHAKRWERTNATLNIERPASKHIGQDDEAPYYTHEELDLLIGMASGELRWFIELAYWTGARRGSIEDLTRGQVRWPQRQILLQPPGKKTTKKRQPIVPIFQQMEPALKALWDTGGETRLFRTSNFYHPYRALCEGLGLEGRAHPHLLRHTRATHLLQAGKPLYAVARLLGDTVGTVERVYGHHSVGHIHRDLGEELGA